MAKFIATTVISAVLLLIFFNAEVSGRFLNFKAADQVVSDGQVANNAAEEVIDPSVLRPKRMDDSAEVQREHMYGYLPCADVY